MRPRRENSLTKALKEVNTAVCRAQPYSVPISRSEIIDVSDWNKLKKVKYEKGWAGLVYYRQLCNGFIDNKYICGTWCAGRTFMSDLSGDKPISLPAPIGFMPNIT
ncbi:MAG: hypothetical protein R6V06_03165 [Kiritimatiellia bacterium]